MNRHSKLIALTMGLLCLSHLSFASGLKNDVREKSPLTTKGDLYTFSTVNTRLPVGIAGQILSVDSSTATGLRWVSPSSAGAGTVTNSGNLTANAVVIGGGTTVISTITADTSTTNALFSTGTSPAFRNITSSDVAVGTFGPIRGGTGFASYTKGDLLTSAGGTDISKLGVGANGQILSVDSTQTLGMKWANASPLTTKGDIYVYASGIARLPIGSNGQILSADSSQVTGLKWVAAPTGGAGTPGGSTGQIQFNNGGSFAGAVSVSTDSTGTLLHIGNNTSGLVSLDVAGNIRSVPFVLTDAATIAIDASKSNLFTVTLGGNRILGTPTNASHGQKIIIFVSQDSTGSRTLTYDSGWRFGTDVVSPTLTTTAGKGDYLGAVFNRRGTTATMQSWDVVSVSKGY